MIYVEYSHEKPMEHRLAKAQETIDLAFDESHYALAFASEISAKRHPDFWMAANRMPLKQEPLAIFSIRYALYSDLPVYEISWDPCFETDSRPEYSEHCAEEPVHLYLPDSSEFINVRRMGVQQYEHLV